MNIASVFQKKIPVIYVFIVIVLLGCINYYTMTLHKQQQPVQLVACPDGDF